MWSVASTLLLCASQQTTPPYSFHFDLFEGEEFETTLAVTAASILSVHHLALLAVNSAQATRDVPAKGWAIASVVSGVFSSIIAITSLVRATDFNSENRFRASLASGILLASAAADGTLGIVNLVHQPKSRPYWALAPAVSEDGANVSLAVRF